MPFQLTPDSRFFFGSAGHSKAIAHLNYGLAQGEGFIVITGEVGAGKTTLVEWLRTQMDPAAYIIARVSTTQVSENDLFRLAMAGFGLDGEGLGKAALLNRFEDVLREHQAAGRRCLLIVDEAQNLSFAALEELRMLSNITVDGRTSLQTILPRPAAVPPPAGQSKPRPAPPAGADVLPLWDRSPVRKPSPTSNIG